MLPCGAVIVRCVALCCLNFLQGLHCTRDKDRCNGMVIASYEALKCIDAQKANIALPTLSLPPLPAFAHVCLLPAFGWTDIFCKNLPKQPSNFNAMDKLGVYD